MRLSPPRIRPSRLSLNILVDNEPIMLRALGNVHFRLGTAADATSLAAYIARTDAPETLREEALHLALALAKATSPPRSYCRHLSSTGGQNARRCRGHRSPPASSRQPAVSHLI